MMPMILPGRKLSEMMIMNKNTNIHIPQQQATVPEAVNALLGFMNDQLRINAGIHRNMKVIEYHVITPLFTRLNAGNNVCRSAFM